MYRGFLHDSTSPKQQPTEVLSTGVVLGLHTITEGNTIAQRGFSVIELMIVIAIVAILLAISAPSIRDFISIHGISSTISDLRADIAFAQEQSVSHVNAASPYAVICASTNGATCSTTAAWDQGWLVGLSTAANGAIAQVLRYHPAVSKTPHVSNDFTITTNPAVQSFSFFDYGSIAAPTFTICRAGYWGKTISVVGGKTIIRSVTAICPQTP